MTPFSGLFCSDSDSAQGIHWTKIGPTGVPKLPVYTRSDSHRIFFIFTNIPHLRAGVNQLLQKISKKYLSLAAQGIRWTKIGPTGVPITSLHQKGQSQNFFYQHKYSSFRGRSKLAVTKNFKKISQSGCKGYTLDQNWSFQGTHQCIPFAITHNRFITRKIKLHNLYRMYPSFRPIYNFCV